MRLRNILFAVLGVGLLAVVGVVVALVTLDFGRFKGPLAAQVARATGRELVFEGEVSLRLFPRPSLNLRDVALVNAPWGSRPHALRIGTLSAEVELRPLLFERALHVTRLVMRDADLLLETDAQGRQNWQLDAAGPALAQAAPTRPAAAGTAQGVRTDAAGLPLIDEIMLSNIAVTWRDARAGGGGHAVLLKDVLLSLRPDGRLALQGEAVLREQKIVIAGDLDLPTGFQAPGGPFVANLTLTLPGTVVKLAGGLADARAGKGLDLSVTAEAEPLKSLDDLVGASLPAVKAHLSARVQGDLGGTLRAAELVVRLGRSDLSGTATLDLAGKRPRITADLDSTRLDLTEMLLPKPDRAGAAAPPASEAAPDGKADGKADGKPGAKPDAKLDAKPDAKPERRLFGTEAFDFAALHSVDADVTLRGAVLETAIVRLEQAMLRLVLADGDLALRPYAFTLSGSHVAGDARLNAAATPPTLALDVAAQRVDVGRLLALVGAPGLIEAKGDVVLALRGSGASPHALASSLDGTASLVVGQGTLGGSYIDRLGLGALRTALPQVQKLAESKLNCAIARFDIARGVATAKLLAADAGDLSMVGSGTVNLGAETVALDLAPRLKLAGIAGLGGVVVPVQVRGSLLEPSVAVLGGRGGVRGNPLAALGAIVLDPGASRTNPCGGLAEVPAAPPVAAPSPGLPSLPGLLRLLPR